VLPIDALDRERLRLCPLDPQFLLADTVKRNPNLNVVAREVPEK
jgi:hypothetical protein